MRRELLNRLQAATRARRLDRATAILRYAIEAGSWHYRRHPVGESMRAHARLIDRFRVEATGGRVDLRARVVDIHPDTVLSLDCPGELLTLVAHEALHVALDAAFPPLTRSNTIEDWATLRPGLRALIEGSWVVGAIRRTGYPCGVLDRDPRPGLAALLGPDSDIVGGELLGAGAREPKVSAAVAMHRLAHASDGPRFPRFPQFASVLSAALRSVEDQAIDTPQRARRVAEVGEPADARRLAVVPGPVARAVAVAWAHVLPRSGPGAVSDLEDAGARVAAVVRRDLAAQETRSVLPPRRPNAIDLHIHDELGTAFWRHPAVPDNRTLDLYLDVSDSMARWTPVVVALRRRLRDLTRSIYQFSDAARDVTGKHPRYVSTGGTTDLPPLWAALRCSRHAVVITDGMLQPTALDDARKPCEYLHVAGPFKEQSGSLFEFADRVTDLTR